MSFSPGIPEDFAYQCSGGGLAVGTCYRDEGASCDSVCNLKFSHDFRAVSFSLSYKVQLRVYSRTENYHIKVCNMFRNLMKITFYILSLQEGKKLRIGFFPFF